MITSKTIIVTTLLGVAATAQAGSAERGGIPGMGAGAAAGALLAGPPGAIVGAGLGAFFGERIGRAAEAERLEAEAATTQAQADRLAAQLAAAETELAERDQAIGELQRRQALAREIELEVLFPTGGAELAEAFDARIERLATLLRTHPGLGVRLDGHADVRGAAARNEALSAARTAAVRGALVAAGVAPARIAGFHHGARGARAAADDPEALALDRRVAIRLEPLRDAGRIAAARAGER